ncbi:hypothetical protein GYMLUDRAFT_244385 [Collybiopsis luxurians FD-317 M1]|uniref:DUF7330 domain-containing protein n=1 Tax=Collybiopsis luxurians FD-317 M1 TaxID=944289 RepID=A0A0D0CNP0_9AGAR|nr:hypothetical protein GYMLUDRAFT_244385 [Collybiopsis luxurians FD-317 M1]
MIVPKDSPDKTSPDSPIKDSSPPPYVPSDPSSSSSAPPFVPPDYLKPSNYVSLNQNHHSVEGTYLLDPSLEIPSEFLAPLPDGIESEDRRSNFYGSSTHGNVSAILYLLNKPMPKSRNKVLLKTCSTNGTVSTCIRRGGLLPAFDLKSESQNGSVDVKIPRTYRGMITGSTKHGRVWMSDAVSAQAVVFSDVEGTKRIFMGDFSARNDETDDSMVLESNNGNVNIYFEDEDLTPAVVKGIKSLLNKFLR